MAQPQYPQQRKAMPNFNEDAFSRSWTKNVQGHTIGIDVAHLLRGLNYFPVLDVLPADFINRVTEVTKHLLLMEKKVILVFDGILREDRQPPAISIGMPRNADDTTPAKFKSLLSKNALNTPSSETMNALFISLIRYFSEPQYMNRVLVMRAPYYAWTQLAAFQYEGCVGDIIGPLDLFAFPNIKRVLLRFLGDEFIYADDTQLPNIDFVASARQSSEARCIQNSVAFFSPVYTASMSLTRYDTMVPSTVRLSYSTLSHEYGFNIWPANKELMIGMSYGSLPVAVVRAIVFENENLHLPMAITFNAEDNPGSVAYPAFRNCLGFMHPLLVQIVYQVIDKFRPANNPHRPPEIKLDEWELKGWEKQHLPHWLNYLEHLGRWARADASYADAVAVHLSVKLKVLDLMGYFTHAMHTETGDDSGLSSFAEALRQCKTSFACAGVLFIESCRTGMLDGLSLLVCPDGSPDSLPSENVLPMLGARIMSLMRLRRNKATDLDGTQVIWNMNILAFTNLSRLSFNVLQQLNLVMAFNTFYARKLPVSVSELYENLIFNEPPTPYMGFLTYKIFTSKTPLSIPDLQLLYPEATHLVEDLRQAAEFFRSVYNMVDAMKEEDSGLAADQSALIKEAYHVCSEALRKIPEIAADCPDLRNFGHQQ